MQDGLQSPGLSPFGTNAPYTPVRQGSPGALKKPGNPGFNDALSFGGRLWRWPLTAIETAADLDNEAWLEPLLQTRGIVDAAARAQFFRPSLRDLCDPGGIADMPLAIERILKAQDARQSVCVFGDYDVDGVCASSLLAEYLHACGITCDVYIPDRRAEGYGLNVEAIADIAKSHQLLVTVDCGSTSIAEIQSARALGLDVIVVDHHQVGAALPAALAVLNPHRPDCSFAYPHLCATGVAFLLVAGLRRAMRARDAQSAGALFDVRQCLDLVAVATIADMVPLTGLNRILVFAGLERLRRAPRPGLLALMRVAQVTPEMVTASDVGFRIGPRINARGRLAHAGLGVTLMRTQDAQQARELAAELDAVNQQRRSVEARVVRDALTLVERDKLQGDSAIVVGDPGWHPGVLGLVASRLTQKFSRPALVIGEGGKGSGRSVDGINLHACLQDISSLLERFGGHPAAAGVTLRFERLFDVRRALCAQVQAKAGPPPYARPHAPELEVAFGCMQLNTVRAISRLEPFGRDNPDILFAAKALFALDVRRVGDTHLKMRLCPSDAPQAGSIDAIAFGQGHLFGRLPPRVDVLFHLERQVFRGLERCQVRIVDLRATAH